MNKTEKTPELLRMGEKNSHNRKIIMRGWEQARITNLEENGARLKEESSSVIQTENADEKYHHDLLRHSGMKNGKVDPMMKRI